MLDLAWENMWMRKVRTALTILGIEVALELVILNARRAGSEAGCAGVA